MSKIWVKPGGDDRKVPWPGIKGRYFSADRAVEVDDADHYIARRLADQDLVKVDAPAPEAPTTEEHG